MSQAEFFDNIKADMAEYAELREIKAGAEKRMKELDPIIRPVLADRGAVQFENHTFTVETVAGRRTLDKKAVEEAGIDLEPFHKQGAPFTILKVKDVK